MNHVVQIGIASSNRDAAPAWLPGEGSRRTAKRQGEAIEFNRVAVSRNAPSWVDLRIARGTLTAAASETTRIGSWCASSKSDTSRIWWQGDSAEAEDSRAWKRRASLGRLWERRAPGGIAREECRWKRSSMEPSMTRVGRRRSRCATTVAQIRGGTAKHSTRETATGRYSCTRRVPRFRGTRRFETASASAERRFFRSPPPTRKSGADRFSLGAHALFNRGVACVMRLRDAATVDVRSFLARSGGW
jgi:hypothetical protein